MALRLNAGMREHIERTLLKHTFDARAKAVRDGFASLAEDVYENVYKADLEQMNALPKGWLPTSYYTTARFGSDFKHLEFSGRFYQADREAIRGLYAHREHVYRPVLSNGKSGDYDARHMFSLRNAQLEQSHAKLAEEYIKAKAKAHSTLRQYTTLEALLTAWPELEPFTRQYKEPDRKARQLPVIQREELNTVFDLPVD